MFIMLLFLLVRVPFTISPAGVSLGSSRNQWTTCDPVHDVFVQEIVGRARGAFSLAVTSLITLDQQKINQFSDLGESLLLLSELLSDAEPTVIRLSNAVRLSLAVARATPDTLEIRAIVKLLQLEMLNLSEEGGIGQEIYNPPDSYSIALRIEMLFLELKASILPRLGSVSTLSSLKLNTRFVDVCYELHQVFTNLELGFDLMSLIDQLSQGSEEDLPVYGGLFLFFARGVHRELMSLGANVDWNVWFPSRSEEGRHTATTAQWVMTSWYAFSPEDVLYAQEALLRECGTVTEILPIHGEVANSESIFHDLSVDDGTS